MKCPNCGAEMKDGNLYCEECGEDIHIVPDFEPELELNMEQSLEQVRESAEVESKRGRKSKKPVYEDDFEDEEVSTLVKVVRAVVWSIVTLVVIAASVVGLSTYHYYSVDYQAEMARKSVAKVEYDNAIQYYNRALELDRRNIALKFELADVYWLRNEKVQYEYLLNTIVNDPLTNTEQLENAYGKLISIYRAKEDYGKINGMLLMCENDTVRNTYQEYMALPPQFSLPGGNYKEKETLKLTSTGIGSVYYTLDGSEPDENSDRYMAPFLLEEGDHEIRAVFVNEKGIASEVVRAEYHIEFDELEAPEFNVDSGDYETPVFITAINNQGDIYYTTDGTDPTLGSLRYTEPIPMPLGVSTFRFARLEVGRSSRVVEKTFDLVLSTEFSSDQAVEKIIDYALSSGKIIDREGHFDESASAYRYQYQYTVHIDDINDFYVVAESYVDVQGISVKTGNYYAVNVYTGNYYKLQVDNRIYTLSEL